MGPTSGRKEGPHQNEKNSYYIIVLFTHNNFFMACLAVALPGNLSQQRTNAQLCSISNEWRRRGAMHDCNNFTILITFISHCRRLCLFGDQAMQN